jgi:hypothetical protein
MLIKRCEKLIIKKHCILNLCDWHPGDVPIQLCMYNNVPYMVASPTGNYSASRLSWLTDDDLFTDVWNSQRYEMDGHGTYGSRQ